MPKVGLTTSLIIPTLIAAMLCAVAAGKTVYVDDDAVGGGNGSSWTDAYDNLQDALTAAGDGDEIWVAQGTYTPDRGAGAATGSREATFLLRNDVSLKGGYAGLNAPDPNARDALSYESILSGDLASDDISTEDPHNLFAELSRAENSYHIVTGSWTDATAAIDGFIIVGGNAEGPSFDGSGGGMLNLMGAPTVRNCQFRANSAEHSGGAILTWGNTNLSITGCRFSGNTANAFGGAVCNVDNACTLTDCSFVGNTASFGGGVDGGSRITLNECVFIGNSAEYGGGMKGGDEVHLMNCVFRDNSATVGGGFWQDQHPDANTAITGCTFSGNIADFGAGALIAAANAAVNNSLFIANSAVESFGGGMSVRFSGVSTMTNCTFAANSSQLGGAALHADSAGTLDVASCILWNGGGEIASDDASLVMVAFSDVQGGFAGTGNIDADPCFAQPGYWDQSEGGQDAGDTFWVDGDYHLKSQAGRWDNAGQSWVQDIVTSPCIDAGSPKSSYKGELSPNGGRINMGTYGGTAEASMSVSIAGNSTDINDACDTEDETPLMFADVRL
ncbi:MAG: right-handed parallel beta-helix repeat-containing protein [Planctomycetota bacterium]